MGASSVRRAAQVDEEEYEPSPATTPPRFAREEASQTHGPDKDDSSLGQAPMKRLRFSLVAATPVKQEEVRPPLHDHGSAGAAEASAQPQGAQEEDAKEEGVEERGEEPSCGCPPLPDGEDGL